MCRKKAAEVLSKGQIAIDFEGNLLSKVHLQKAHKIDIFLIEDKGIEILLEDSIIDNAIKVFHELSRKWLYYIVVLKNHYNIAFLYYRQLILTCTKLRIFLR